MTGTKLWRLSLAAILGFGWLFLTPAYSDDPLSIAAQEIQKLNDSVTNLNYRTDFESLISVAESKYDDAVNARDAKNEASSIYDAALSAKSIALNEKLFAQTAVEGQTAIVANAQNNLDIASINLSTAQIQYPVQGTPGLNAYLYDCWTSWNSYNNAPQFGCGTTPISMGPWTSMWWNFGGGGPAGLYDDYQIHLVGYIKQTQHWTPQFRTCGDDGMVIIINGVTVASDWYDRGGGCGISNGYYMPNNDWVPIEIWWYENGGGANGEAQWNIGNGFVTIPSNVLSTEIPFSAPELITAQEDYNNKLSIYNQEVQTLQALQSNLTLANQNLTLADQNLTSAQTEKDNSVLAYDQSIVDLNNSINVAWNYYEEQLAREIAIALAQAAAAAANQPTPEPSPQPTEESTPEPSPEPSPEQTKPIDPTPEPSSDTTDEPKPEPSSDPEPTPEPSQEPSPQPTDIDPETTPEPEPIPTEPSEESQDNVIIKDEELLELIPEKGTGTSEDLSGVIANLTSKDNKLVTLSPEQVAAVSQTLVALTNEAKAEVAQDLGIKATEVAVIAEAMKSNPELATAFVEFKDRESAAAGAAMPYTLADATTEVQTEAFLADPIGAVLDIDLSKVLSPSEWGKDMTDDQREKAQEVVIPVIIASNIVAAAMTRRI